MKRLIWFLYHIGLTNLSRDELDRFCAAEMKPMQKKMWKKVWLLLLLCLPAHAVQGIRIKCERVEGSATITAWGSACFVEKHKLLTCWHVMDAGGVTYAEVGGNWMLCKLVKNDKVQDMALWEVAATGEPLELVSLPVLIVSGSPLGVPIKERTAALHNAIIKCDIDIGDSGAPLTADGKLIGIVKAKIRMEDTTYARIIGADKIAEFLK